MCFPKISDELAEQIDNAMIDAWIDNIPYTAIQWHYSWYALKIKRPYTIVEKFLWES